MKRNILLVALVAVCVISLVGVGSLLAQDGGSSGGTGTGGTSGSGSPITLPNPLGNDSDFYDLLSRFIRILTFFSAPILSALVVYAGFLYLTGGSNPAKRTTATNIIKYGIIGFVIIILANVIVAVVRGAIGA